MCFGDDSTGMQQRIPWEDIIPPEMQEARNRLISIAEDNLQRQPTPAPSWMPISAPMSQLTMRGADIANRYAGGGRYSNPNYRSFNTWDYEGGTDGGGENPRITPPGPPPGGGRPPINPRPQTGPPGPPPGLPLNPRRTGGGLPGDDPMAAIMAALMAMQGGGTGIPGMRPRTQRPTRYFS